MIKFTDVCKAYIRYWFVIVVAVVISLSAVLALTNDKESYTATNMVRITVKQESADKGQFITPNYAEVIVNEMKNRMGHDDFLAMVVDDIKANPDTAELGNALTPAIIRANMKIIYNKGDMMFKISYNNINEANAQIVASALRDKIIVEQAQDKKTQAMLEPTYSTRTQPNASKTMVYAVIGVLIGLVLGVVIVTFFVVFNPYVENKELVSKETGLTVLAALDKARGDK